MLCVLKTNQSLTIKQIYFSTVIRKSLGRQTNVALIVVSGQRIVIYIHMYVFLESSYKQVLSSKFTTSSSEMQLQN